MFETRTKNMFPVQHYKDENYLTDHFFPKTQEHLLPNNLRNESCLTAKQKRKRLHSLASVLRGCIDADGVFYAGQARNVKLTH